MQFLDDKKDITLSVRDFSYFGSIQQSQPKSLNSRRRAQEGLQWHKSIESETLAKHKGALAEYSINKKYKYRDWILHFQGRIDLLVPDQNIIRAREIKTITHKLPISKTTALEINRPYFIQAATYAHLLQQDKTEKIIPEIVLFNVHAQSHQIITLDEIASSNLFQLQLDKIRPYLDARWQRIQQTKIIKYYPPFKELRPEQKNLQSKLENIQSSTIAIEAPTGFGKTGIILDYSLKKLQKGEFRRILYLTGKKTGQIEVLKQVGLMSYKDDDSLVYFQIRSKKEHSQRCHLSECQKKGTCTKGPKKRLHSTLYSRSINSESLAFESICSTTETNGDCPYETSRTALPFSNIWISDYNYIFSPQNQNFLFSEADFHPSETLVIIDEAHNLSSRTSDCYSEKLSKYSIEKLSDEIAFLDLPTSFNAKIERLASELKAKELTHHKLKTLKELLKELSDILESINTEEFTFTEQSEETIQRIHYCNYLLRLESTNFLIELDPQSLNIFCINPAPYIQKQIKRFSKTILTSATLRPISFISSELGLNPEEITFIEADTPWRKKANQTAIDMRVNTRLKDRSHHYWQTAETVTMFLEHTEKPPVVAFLPSYQYLDEILQRIEVIAPTARISAQEKNLGIESHKEFIEEALIGSDILLLVLGSSFSESINMLGGKIQDAVIISPALPEASPRLKSKYQMLEADPRISNPFEHAYLIPGLQKINQALGRLVRAPNHRARILLHCQRFAKPEFFNLLHKDYQTNDKIYSNDDLSFWLNKTSRHSLNTIK